ncbi:MAG: hypothetical protein KOO63_02500 [Bacteroidales bacterium]|nr:hypothetical protein [Candidatus Latescibacterota bacterium]
MDFLNASKLGSLISKEYARSFFRLLATYSDISASEAASRLDIHIKTAQDFLEGLHQFKIVSRKEVSEKKRPYFRYSLIRKQLTIDIDLAGLADPPSAGKESLILIKEKKNSGVIFKTFGKNDFISSIHFFTGKGRSRDERRISLTNPQGKFLFHLPFPTENHLSVEHIMKKSDTPRSYLPEIMDIVDLLIDNGIVETSC